MQNHECMTVDEVQASTAPLTCPVMPLAPSQTSPPPPGNRKKKERENEEEKKNADNKASTLLHSTLLLHLPPPQPKKGNEKTEKGKKKRPRQGFVGTLPHHRNWRSWWSRSEGGVSSSLGDGKRRLHCLRRRRPLSVPGPGRLLILVNTWWPVPHTKRQGSAGVDGLQRLMEGRASHEKQGEHWVDGRKSIA
jgi:hypothetical protein